MAIVSVRFYFWSENKELELKLSQTHWGFSEWFVRRLKPLRARLRGPEAKGVDLVNFMLYENPQRAWRLHEWAQRANSFNYDCRFDLHSLVGQEPVKNIETLMAKFSAIAADAPWPQMAAVAEALGAPLSESDRESLAPFLNWPHDLSQFLGKIR